MELIRVLYYFYYSSVPDCKVNTEPCKIIRRVQEYHACAHDTCRVKALGAGKGVSTEKGAIEQFKEDAKEACGVKKGQDSVIVCVKECEKDGCKTDAARLVNYIKNMNTGR